MYPDKTKKICLAGLFAAIIYLTTAYFFHIPTGPSGGYLHFGDAFIYLAGSILPAPYAAAAGAIGAGLSDALTPGAIVWLPATLIVKSLVALSFTRRGKTILCKHNSIALVLSCVITTVGYYIAGVLLTGDPAGGLAQIPVSLLQSAGSSLCYVLCGYLLDRVKMKSRLMI